MGKISKLLTGLLLLVVTAGLNPAATADVETPIQPFYQPPATLPAEHGVLIKSARQPLIASLPGINTSLPAKATRVMYSTVSSTGKMVPVTGIYLEPSQAWIGRGHTRPLVSFSVGTHGQGDHCAPSYLFEKGFILTTNGGIGGMVAYEIPAVYSLLSRGIAVIITDYVGLGVPNLTHTYVDRRDLGRAVLDAATVASQVPGSTVKSYSPVATYGYSQGGGASAAAAELWKTYAPHLNLVGSYAGAPPANLSEVLKGIDGGMIGSLIGYEINGFSQTFPKLQSKISALVNPVGAAALAKVKHQCVGESAISFPLANTKNWTKSGQSLAEIVAADPELQAAMKKQNLGKAVPAAPIRVATGIYDDAVDHAQARAIALRYCRMGANTTYVPIYVPNLGDKTALNHVAPMPLDMVAATKWVQDRLSGEMATSNCAKAATLP